MQNVKEAGAHWIARHLQERWPNATAAIFQEVALNLDAIASEYEIPVETVIEWIHLVSRDGEVSCESFRAWAEQHAAERERALADARRGL